MRLLLLHILLSIVTLTAAQPPLIPRQAFFQEKDQYNIRLSPDGQRVYYQRRSVQEGRLFYIETQRPGRELHLDAGGALLDWQPTHTGGLLAVVQRKSQQLAYLTDSDQQAITLFPFQQLRIEALSPRRPREFVASITAEADSLNGIYRINFNTGAMEKISGPLIFQKLYFSQKLDFCAARMQNDINGYSIYRFDGREWNEALRCPFDESQFIGGFQDVVSVSADGRYFYATDNTGRDKTVLLSVEVATGQQKLLVADSKADILPFGAMVGPDGRPQMVLSVFADARRHFLDARAQADFDYANRLLNSQASFADASADGNTWLLRRLDGGPMTYYLYTRGDRKLTRLFSDIPGLSAAPMASRRASDVVTRDGYNLPVHVYLPPGADADGDGLPEKPLPTILYVHGGPWVGVVHWNNWFHTRNFELLANRGYAVINTEFRGTTGLGKQFTDLGDRQWGGNMLNDLLDIADWAVEAGIGDREKLGIWGWSYGGYAAAAALAFAPDTFACGIAMYGPADLDAFLRIPFTDNNIWRTRVGDPNTPEGQQLLRSYSPTNYVSQFKSPILLTTGSKDGRVPQQQVDALARALHDAQKEVVYFYYPDEVHDYRDPGSWLSFWAIAEQFLHRYLGGQAEPVRDGLKKGNFKVVYGEDWINNN
ncbi:MAG: S9 family peptidase [Lewinellaceae bacterium]|nr:S9 family peptidase [Lewinellaceae bacterium]